MASNKNIPMEITIKILSQLPVKSLFRFKCVSKSWKTLIESSDFFKLHLNQSLRINSYNCSLILSISVNLIVNGCPTIVPFLYRAYLGHNSINLDINKLVLPPSFQPSLKINTRHTIYRGTVPSQKKVVLGSIEVAGSCNGLVLILSGRHHIAVYNPAIEQGHASFKIIPCIEYLDTEFHYRSYQINYENQPYSRYGFRNFKFRVFGFGYDCYSNCYKIVYLTPRRALIYSLMKDSCSWRKIDLPDFGNNLIDSSIGENQEMLYIHAYNHGVLVNHHLHWSISKYDQHIVEHSTETILRFNLHHEEWDEVPVPDVLYQRHFIKGYLSRSYIIELGALNGCLCLLISRGISYPHLELWIMKEYGVKESWRKLCNVPNGSGIPLVYRMEQNEILLPGIQHGLGWYNPNQNKIKKIGFHGCEFTGEHCYSTKVKMCIESFVNPFTSIEGGEETKEIYQEIE